MHADQIMSQNMNLKVKLQKDGGSVGKLKKRSENMTIIN